MESSDLQLHAIPVSSFLRTLIVGGVCVHVAGAFGVEAASFPLLITAMTSHVRGKVEAARVATQLGSHVISVAAAAILIGLLQASGPTFWQDTGHSVFSVACLLLLSLQFTRLRHPPALASGGSVLCGVDPIAVLGCVTITGSVLLAEPLLLRIWRLRH